MENPVIIILVIAALVGVVFFIFLRKKKDKGKPLKPDDVLFCPPPEMKAKYESWGGSYPHVYESPGGVMVYSGVEVPREALETLDRAAEFSIKVQKAQFPEWTKMLKHSEFEVFFVEADGKTDESKLPYLTRSGVETAGTVAFCDGAGWRKQRTPAFLPDFRLVNWERLDDLFWFAFNEWEHSREIQNNPEYAKTFFVSNDEHPHKHEGKPSPYEFMPRGLMSKPVPRLSCGFGVQ